MRRATRSSTRSRTGSPPNEADSGHRVTLPPGLDEEQRVSLGYVRGDHDRQRSHLLGLATGVLESTRQLTSLLWIVQEDVHDEVIDSRDERLDYRYG
jgi:hypothetical protein